MTGIAEVLAPLSARSDALAWVVVGAFLAAALAEAAGRTAGARRVGAGAWALFGLFWLSVFPDFAFGMRSPIEGTLSLLAVPACLYAGYLLADGRDSLLTLSRAVAFMGLLYLPVETVPLVRRTLIETVAAQTHFVIASLGYAHEFGPGPDYGYRNRFAFVTGGRTFATYIVTACTGIGSIAIFGGLVAAVRVPLRRRARAFLAAVGVIWVLNVARNVFIAVAFGNQWFQQGPLVAFVTSYVHPDPTYTSYFVADRVLAQSLSVVALVGITWLVVRELPEVLAILEEALYVVLRREVDLAAELGVDPGPAGGGPAAATDGGSAPGGTGRGSAPDVTDGGPGTDVTDGGSAPGGTGDGSDPDPEVSPDGGGD